MHCIVLQKFLKVFTMHTQKYIHTMYIHIRILYVFIKPFYLELKFGVALL